MKGRMVSRPRWFWLGFPQRQPRVFTEIFWFFLKDEKFVSKTINDSNIDLDKFPASKARQLRKWRVQR